MDRRSCRRWHQHSAYSRSIEVLLHDAVTGPLTCGVLRPSIVLPAGARQWDVTSLRCALRHEIEHVSRWDFLTHCLSRIVCAAYGFIHWSGPPGGNCGWKLSGRVMTPYCGRTMQATTRRCSSPSRSGNRRTSDNPSSRWRVVTISLRVSQPCWMCRNRAVALDGAGQSHRPLPQPC